ncbi:MAG TPA: MBL fold metallo-hydrolase [Actinophytocola sp.]|uniref:MBL fold metallo-hydrolase n=1 Tax=Actinophytocola sp. TaxID=1872138 RepID=UPI002DFC8D83|nr:MBL fold metallo-hydrolase [Actinophytocola sp.]
MQGHRHDQPRASSETRVRVTVAGSGDAFGSAGRQQACIHLQPLTGGPAVLLDCGASALSSLKRLGLEPNDIATVVVSHLHGDHVAGLPYLVLDGQFQHRTGRLQVIGPPGTRARLPELMEILFPGSTTVGRRFEVRVNEVAAGGSVHVGGVTVDAYRAEHAAGAPALALRVAFADRVVGYSGDTAWTDALVDVARDADLFICEAYTLTRRVPYHLDVASLRANLGRLRCHRLLLTHASPDVLDHRADLDLPLAEDGTVILI